jgi:hypothetical protein
MCFVAEVDEELVPQIIDFISEFLKQESAPGSDPDYVYNHRPFDQTGLADIFWIPG